MPLFDFMDVNKLKAELAKVTKERDQLKKAMSVVERMEAFGLQKAVQGLLAKQKQINEQIQAAQFEAQQRLEVVQAQTTQQRSALDQQINELNRQIAAKHVEVVQL